MTTDKVKRYYYYYSLILITFVLILIYFSPIFRGVYFPREWYPLKLSCFILFSLYFGFRLFQKDKPIIKNFLDFTVLAFAFFYLISIIGAVSPQAALAEFLKVATYVVIYFMIRVLLEKEENRQSYTYLILNTFLLAGLTVSLIGLAGATGALPYTSLYDGARIHSTFQYHNASAIYLTALFLLATAMSANNSKLLNKLTYLGASLIFLIMVVLTYSRGAWLVLAACFVLYLIFSLPGQRVKTIIHFILMLAITFLSINFFERYISEKLPLHAFALLAILVIIFLGISMLIEVYLSRRLNKDNSKLPILLMLCFILFSWPLVNSVSGEETIFSLRHNEYFPNQAHYLASNQPAENIISRVSDINLETFSVTERFTYYRTALKIFLDYPLTGAGGGAWEVLYLDYLDELYPEFMHTTEVHSHYLKVLIESGILGLLSFLLILFLFTMGFLRCRLSKDAADETKKLSIAVFIPFLAIAAHSAIDFGLSLGALSAFLWILLALGSTHSATTYPKVFKSFADKISVRGQTVISVTGFSAFLFLIALTIYLY